jgi:nicotinate-nucleotide pyrophosphorylase (carboxylating)
MLDLIRRAIEEDVNGGDITSRLLFPRPGKAQAVITAKEEGVVAGMMVAMAVFVMRDSKVKFMPLVMDGSRGKTRAANSLYRSGSGLDTDRRKDRPLIS